MVHSQGPFRARGPGYQVEDWPSCSRAAAERSAHPGRAWAAGVGGAVRGLDVRRGFQSFMTPSE